MEYCSHGDLSHYIPNHGKTEEDLSWDERIRMLKEIAISLAYLHARKIIHRFGKTMLLRLIIV